MGVDPLIQNVTIQNVTSCYAAPVGVIGDPVARPRVRQSAPWMPWAYDPYWTVARAAKCLGANVQNGDQPATVRGTYGAHTLDANWDGNRTNKHQYGFTMHSVQPPDKSRDPVLRSLGRQSWESKLARTVQAKRLGKLFSVLPYGYAPAKGAVLRGGNFPTVAEVSGGTNPPAGTSSAMMEPVDRDDVVTGVMDADEGPLHSPMTPGGMGDLRSGMSRLGFQNMGMRQRFGQMRL